MNLSVIKNLNWIKLLIIAWGVSWIADAQAQMRPLVIAFAENRPPYVFSKAAANNENASGIEIELMHRLFDKTDYKFTIRLIPASRLETELRFGLVDAIVGVAPEDPSIYYSSEFLRNHYVIVTYLGKKIKLKASLDKLRIVATKGASATLGPEYVAIVAQKPSYLEINDPRRVIDMFLNGRVDGVVIDPVVFQTIVKQSNFNPNNFEYNYIFSRSLSGEVGFVREDLRDIFQDKLNDFKANGDYGRLLEKYGVRTFN